MSRDSSFGVYIHWPFCLSKCPYCDFNSHVREGVDAGAWQAARLAMATRAERMRVTRGKAGSSMFAKGEGAYGVGMPMDSAIPS